jgi:hypothetical protein
MAGAQQPVTGTPTPAEPAVEAPAEEKKTVKPNGENGFPTETPIAEMTVEQRESYWRYQSKKHETAEEKARNTASEQQKQLADTLRENAKLKLQREHSNLTDDVFEGLAPQDATAEQLTTWGTKMAAVLAKVATPAAPAQTENLQVEPEPKAPTLAQTVRMISQPKAPKPTSSSYEDTFKKFRKQ